MEFRRVLFRSTPSGCEEDFHLQAVIHARRTNAIPGLSGDAILPSFFERHGADGEDDVDLAGWEAELITRVWILKVLRRIASERSSVGGKCSEHAQIGRAHV